MGSNTKDVAIRFRLEDGDKTLRGMEQLGAKGNKALKQITLGTTPASRGLKAVDAVAGDLRGTLMATASNAGVVGSGLTALGPAGLAGAAGIGALALSINALLDHTRAAVEGLSEIKKEAQQAGAGVEAYQALRYAAESYQVSQAALTDGLKEMNLRIDEFVRTGSGSAAESLKRLGFTQEDLNSRLGDTSGLFLEIIDRMHGLENQAARIRVADEIFGGTGGEQFVQMLDSGSAAIRQLMQDARELGYVVDANIIERADESRRQLAQLERLVDVQLNQAFVDLAPVLITIAETFADVARAVADVVDGFRDLEDMSGGGLRNKLADLKTELSDLIDEQRNLQEMLVERQQSGSGNTSMLESVISGKGADIEETRKEIARLQEILDGRERTRASASSGGGSGTVGAGQVNPVDDYLTRINKRISAKQTEINVIDQSAGAQARARAEFELNNIVAEKGIELTDQQREALRRSLSDLESTTDRFKELSDAQRESAQRSAEFGSIYVRTMEDITFKTKTASEAVQSFVQDLIKLEYRKRVLEPAGQVFGSGLDSVISGFNEWIKGGGAISEAGSASTGAVVAHSGGDVRNTGTTRTVPLSTFHDADRYHGGGNVLGPGEVPVIAEEGERMLTEAQQTNIATSLAAMARMVSAQSGGGGGGMRVSLNVQNSAPNTKVTPRASQSSNGELRIDVLVEQVEGEMARHIAKGEGLAPVIEQRYGVAPGANSY